MNKQKLVYAVCDVRAKNILALYDNQEAALKHARNDRNAYATSFAVESDYTPPKKQHSMTVLFERFARSIRNIRNIPLWGNDAR